MTAPARYVKRPLAIEAMQVTADTLSAARAWIRSAKDLSVPWMQGDECVGLDVLTLEGWMHLPFGHWLIRGIKGEFYGCDPDVFAATYDKEPA